MENENEYQKECVRENMRNTLLPNSTYYYLYFGELTVTLLKCMVIT